MSGPGAAFKWPGAFSQFPPPLQANAGEKKSAERMADAKTVFIDQFPMFNAARIHQN
jgi:hypothetical protein